MSASWGSLNESFERLSGKNLPHWQNYLGFYSSWLNGYFKEPWGMLIPMDDHGFHRGDGVFEAVRIQNGAFFDLQSHLDRLGRSSQAIGMKLPKSLKEIESIVVNLAKLCDSRDGLLRLFITRGPGGFSPSPAEVVGHQIYASINKLKVPDAKAMSEGVRTMISTVAAKDPWWSQVKSCNYLQNVLMKQEVLNKGYDFALSVDGQGRICEGSTENFMIVSAAGEMLIPKFDYTLRGTTLSVVKKIAETMKKELHLSDIRFADLSLKDVQSAKEAAFVGTTLGVLPVQSLDGQAIGDGKPGEISKILNRELLKKMDSDATLRTTF